MVINSDTVAELMIDSINNNERIKGINIEEDIVMMDEQSSTLIRKKDIIDGVDIDMSRFGEVTDKKFFQNGVKMDFDNMSEEDRRFDAPVKVQAGETTITVEVTTSIREK